MKILVCVADGSEEMETIIPVDIWRRAGYDVEMISITGRLQIIGSHGILFSVEKLFENADFNDADAIFLPGGGQGTRNLDSHKGLADTLKKFYAEGKYLFAVCAAPSIFGHNGILKGKKATCFPGFEKELTGATFVDEQVVVDGKVITGNAAGAAMKLAMEVVRLIDGNEKADDLAEKIKFKK